MTTPSPTPEPGVFRRQWPAAAALAALVACLVLLAAVPPVSRDALTHHLLVPKLWLHHGALVELPRIRFAYYPMNLELLYLGCLYLGSDVAPKYIHLLFGLLTAGLIFRHLRHRLGAGPGLWGALVFLFLPVVVQLSITAYVDLGLMFFSFAALRGLLKWSETGFRPAWLVASGVCCGLALGTKYNALVVFFLTSLAVVFLYDAREGVGKARPLRALAWATVYAAVALAVFSPWMVRNYRWKGHPLYPLKIPALSRLLAGDNASPRVATGKGRPPRLPLDHFSYRHFAFGESWGQIAAIPVRVFFQGEDDDPEYFDGRLNPCLFFFPIAALALIRRRSADEARERLVLGGFSLCYLLFAFFSIDMRIRYLAPILPPLTVLCIYGVCDLAAVMRGLRGSGSSAFRALVPPAFLVLLLIPNGFYLARQFREVRPLDFLRGKVDRDAYIERYLPEYALLRFANEHLPENARILALFLGNRLYYSDRETVDDIGLFGALVRRSKSGDDLVRNLSRRGYTHLLVRHDLFSRWMTDNAGPAARQRLTSFFHGQAALLYSANGLGLYALGHAR